MTAVPRSSVELLLLKCLRCGTFVPAQEEEVAWVCAQCGQGLKLTPAGLEALQVNWAAARSGAAQVNWHPFWVFDGTVHFSRRETYGAFGSVEPDRLWNSARRFYVPAFPSSLQQMQALGADLTRQQVALKAGPPIGSLAHCTLSPDDARHVVEFVVLTIEAYRKDKLKAVDFSLDLQAPELWVLPFAGEAEGRNLVLGG